MRIDKMIELAVRLESDAKRIDESLVSLQQNAEKKNAVAAAIAEVSTVVSQAAEAAQLRFGGIVSGVVTECLNAVYPDNPYEFRIEFRESAGKTVADALVYRDGEPLDPLSSTGGGVWDVLAFALRVSLLILTARSDTRRLLVLDEPFKFLHGVEIQRRAYKTMETVAEKFGLTVLCVRQH